MKFIYLFLAILLVQTHNSCAQFTSPSEQEIAEGKIAAEKEETKLKTELRLIYDLEEGINRAKEEDKPILLIFTGYGVVNSIKLERNEISENKKVYKYMKDDFVNVWLFVDDKRPSGQKWKNLQKDEYNGDTLPQIFVLDSKGNKMEGGFGYPEAAEKLLPLLKKYAN